MPQPGCRERRPGPALLGLAVRWRTSRRRAAAAADPIPARIFAGGTGRPAAEPPPPGTVGGGLTLPEAAGWRRRGERRTGQDPQERTGPNRRIRADPGGASGGRPRPFRHAPRRLHRRRRPCTSDPDRSENAPDPAVHADCRGGGAPGADRAGPASPGAAGKARARPSGGPAKSRTVPRVARTSSSRCASAGEAGPRPGAACLCLRQEASAIPTDRGGRRC